MLEVIAHHFIGGTYAKDMIIPEDYRVVSHAHKYDHMSILAEGTVIVESDDQQETYFAPAVIEIKAGVHHSVLAVNGPARWFCVHATSETDVDKVDSVLIEKSCHMQKMDWNVPVKQLAEELAEQPELWNANTMRTKFYADSPHREADDIWIRYRDWSEYDPGNPKAFSDEHESVWYPAYYKLPAIDWILAHLQNNLGDFDLGGILITRIPPGKQVYRHSDAESWHATHYREKVLVVVQSAPGQTFNYDRESHEGEAGNVFLFDNAPPHWVVNDSDVDRISLIFSIKRKP